MVKGHITVDVLEERMNLIQQLYNERLVNIDKELVLKEKALLVQAKEYERRLDSLNHEASRILESQSKSISVDRFEGFSGQIHTKIDNINHALGEKISVLSRQVYIITGGIIVIEFIIKFIYK